MSTQYCVLYATSVLRDLDDSIVSARVVYIVKSDDYWDVEEVEIMKVDPTDTGKQWRDCVEAFKETFDGAGCPKWAMPQALMSPHLRWHDSLAAAMQDTFPV